MDETRSEIAERFEHEGPVCEARMRDFETGSGKFSIAVKQQIEIQAAGRVALRPALAALGGFDLEQALHQRVGAQRAGELDRAIQVRTLGRRADGVGLVERRDRDDFDAFGSPQRGDSRRQMCVAIAEIRTHRDVDLLLHRSAIHGGILQLQSSVVSALSNLPPALVTPIPGPRSRALARRLGAVECRNIICVDPEPPIFWERASGSNVWDVDGNRFVDLTSAFGVSNVGHAHPRVSRAVAEQAERLLHAMGDVHPCEVRVELLEALARHFPGGVPARAMLGSSGSDAVEMALETALLATRAPGVVAFEGAYHGLSLGARDATWRPMFREPFAARLPGLTAFARFGEAKDVRRAAQSCAAPVGALLVEPIQGRGGERIPPDGFLSELRAICDGEGWLLIADEVYTGFGRTGRWFACDHEGVIPDLLCVAKGLASGMPISACLGRAEIMDAWPASDGEALRTQTFLGHPPSCAAALASIAILEEEKLVERAAELGTFALERLREHCDGRPQIQDVRGRGLLLALEVDTPERANRACARALAAGVIALPSGDDGRALAICPPLSIDRDLLELAIERLVEAIA